MSEPQAQLLDFPRTFPIKAIGKAEADFRELVMEIVRRHAPELSINQVSVRESSGGKWLSVTLVILAKNQMQLDAIYRDLSSHDRVAWTL
ncbi:MAG TPA: DUF493 domain-containing protein [Chromatiaceae bacterium]|jgi:putative lipoic acid-binding regulatory protein|nr:DUF493 domain-containing protein [Chromatiaceae bacterium]